MMKFIKPEDVAQKLQTFAPNMAVTVGKFEIDVPGFLEDMDWNHMDQLHRSHVHNTYDEAVRIAVGKDFAVSLTRWRKIPLFITVSDIRIKPGLFYQCMTIAGLIFVHFIISMEEVNEVVHTKLEWNITSHKWLKFLHKPLDKMLTKLNTRLQIEDSQIRKQRYHLRKNGYCFASDPADYYSSNNLRNNTIYPELPELSAILLSQFEEGVIQRTSLGKVGFLIKKTTDEYLIWPEVCPHEGGDLLSGKLIDKNQLQCPWHGLRFSAIVVSKQQAQARGYGFDFCLIDDSIKINQISVVPRYQTVAEVEN
jgi:hypothetical protein